MAPHSREPRRGQRHRESAFDALSAREREVLRLIAHGRNTRQIAETLEISTDAVKLQREGLMRRVGTRDIAGLVLFAAQHGLVNLDGENHSG